MRNELRLLERRWGLALHSAQFGVWDLDIARQRVLYSPQWKDMLGYGATDEEDDAATWRARVHPDELQGMLAAQVDHIAGRTETYQCEFRILASDGRYRWVMSRGRVVERDSEGKALRMIGTLTDLTDRREAETLRRERDLAEAATRAKADFLSRMSHELRTPLNAVLGFAQLLAQQLGESNVDDQRRYTTHIEDAGWQLLAMVDDVLDITSMERGQLQMRPQALPLAPLVQQACERMRPLADRRAVSIRFSGAPADAVVLADAERLDQVLKNLLSNAIKYNRDGGGIDVAIADAPDGWQVAMTDTGPGIGAVQMAHLFEPFNRLGRAGSSTTGVGIGLVLTRWLVEAMGGEISARSTVGVGSTFAFSLPRGA